MLVLLQFLVVRAISVNSRRLLGHIASLLTSTNNIHSLFRSASGCTLVVVHHQQLIVSPTSASSTALPLRHSDARVAMTSADNFLHRAAAYIEDARDLSQSASSRFDALDTARAALLDARRAHANPSFLLPLFTDLLTTAAGDSSYLVRIVVPHVIEDLCYRDLKSFVPPSTSFLLRSLHDDHVLVAKRAVRTLTTLYRKLIGFAVHVGISDETFPEARLTVWLQMHTKAISYIQASDDGLRKAATKFAESVVLAFSYSGGGASPDHFTLDYLDKRGSTSPLLNAAKLQSQGISTVQAVAHLVRQALDGQLFSDKPNGDMAPRLQGLPPSSFMTAIFVLGILVRRRPTLIEVSLPPLLEIVTAITASTVENRPPDEINPMNRRPRPSQAFFDLSHGQQLSILNMLKLSLHALRGYAHTRSETWNIEINRAMGDLASYEQSVEMRKEEHMPFSISQQHKQQGPHSMHKIEPRDINHNEPTSPPQHPSSLFAHQVNADSGAHMRFKKAPNLPHPSSQSSLLAQPPTGAMRTLDTISMGSDAHAKRPRSAPIPHMNTFLGVRLSTDDAYVATQAIVQTMRPQEVVNFIMTRLLLNIPPSDTVPGASASPASNSASRRSKKRSLASVSSQPSEGNEGRGDHLQPYPQSAISNPQLKSTTNIPSQNAVPSNASSGSSKRAKRSRFGSDRANVSSLPANGSEFGPTSASDQNAQYHQSKKSVRKTMPPVIPAKLSVEATDRLIVMCCKRMVQRESVVRSCGAGPLRLQLLARILSSLLDKRSEKTIFAQFCDDVCHYIVQNIERTIPLALAWLHSLVVSQHFSNIQTKSDHIQSLSKAIDHPSSIAVPTGSAQPDDTALTSSTPTTAVDSSVKDIKNDVPNRSQGKNVAVTDTERNVVTSAENISACTTKPNINNSNYNAPQNNDVASIDEEAKDQSALNVIIADVKTESIQIDDQVENNADNEIEKNTSDKIVIDKNGSESHKSSNPEKENDSMVKPPDQSINEANVSGSEITKQNQSQSQIAMSSIDTAGKEMQIDTPGKEMQTLQNPEAATNPAKKASSTDKDVAITEMNDGGETVVEEMLSDSEDDSEYDDDMNDVIDSEIVGKLNGKEGNEKSLYAELFYKILSMLKEREEVNTDVFGKLISDAPTVPHDVLQFMLAMCTDPSSIKKGLQTVCTVAMQRPGKDRIKCLSLLFNLACNDDDAVRGPTVRLVCNHMFVEPGQLGVRRLIEQGTISEVGKSVDIFISSFRSMSSHSLPQSSENGSSTSKETFKSAEIRLQRVSLLLTALCAQKHELVLELGRAFVKLPRLGKAVLKRRAIELADHVGITSQPFVDLVDGKLLCGSQTSVSDGAEELALALLKSGVKKHGAADKRVVNAAIHRYDSCENLEFVIAVLQGLSRDQVILYLGDLVEYAERGGRERDRQVQQQGSQAKETMSNKNGENIKEIHMGDDKAEPSDHYDKTDDAESKGTSASVTGNDDGEGENDREVFQEIIGKVVNKNGVGMMPDDFLMELHKLKPSVAVGAAIQKCIKHRGIFVQEAIAQAIQQLMDDRQIPEMFMRTVILARVFYPEMEAYLTDTVMTGLISKRVWTNKVLWDGFVLYCVQIRKAAVKLLLKLPVKQLEDALKRKAELRALFRELLGRSNRYLKKIPQQHRKVISTAINRDS